MFFVKIYNYIVFSQFLFIQIEIYSYAIIFRHGQREPVKLQEKLLEHKLQATVSSSKLKYVENIPSEFRYYSKYNEECIGVLTDQGFQQGLQLGRIIEQNYNISKHKNINHQTTNRQRTFYTSIAVQQGIHNKIIQRPQILPSKQVSLSLFKNIRYREESDKIIQDLYDQNIKFFIQVYNLLHTDKESYNPIQVVDAIVALKELNKNMWSQLALQLTEYQIQVATRIQKQYFCSLFFSDKTCYYAIEPILHILLQEFKIQTQPQTRLLCAHDVTLFSLKKLFTNLPQNDIQYCETLIIKYNLQSKDIFIDIIRNNRVTQVENCRIKNLNEYENLVQYLDKQYQVQM